MNFICQSFWFQVCSPWQLSFLIKELTCSAILSSSSISCQSQLCSWAAPIWYAPIVGLLISALLFNISCILICYYLYHHSPLRTQGRDKYLIVPRTVIYKQSNSINHTIFILEDEGFVFCFVLVFGFVVCVVFLFVIEDYHLIRFPEILDSTSIQQGHQFINRVKKIVLFYNQKMSNFI